MRLVRPTSYNCLCSGPALLLMAGFGWSSHFVAPRPPSDAPSWPGTLPRSARGASTDRDHHDLSETISEAARKTPRAAKRMRELCIKAIDADRQGKPSDHPDHHRYHQMDRFSRPSRPSGRPSRPSARPSHTRSPYLVPRLSVNSAARPDDDGDLCDTQSDLSRHPAFFAMHFPLHFKVGARNLR